MCALLSSNYIHVIDGMSLRASLAYKVARRHRGAGGSEAGSALSRSPELQVASLSLRAVYNRQTYIYNESVRRWLETGTNVT